MRSHVESIPEGAVMAWVVRPRDDGKGWLRAAGAVSEEGDSYLAAYFGVSRWDGKISEGYVIHPREL